MASKSYRAKANAEDLREITFPTSDGYRTIKTFPYSTEDAEEQAYLDGHPLVTDRPATSSRSNNTDNKEA